MDKLISFLPFLMVKPNGKYGMRSQRVAEGVVISLLSGLAAALLTSYIAVQRIEERLIAIDGYMRHEHDSIVRDIDRLDRRDLEFDQKMMELHTEIKNAR